MYWHRTICTCVLALAETGGVSEDDDVRQICSFQLNEVSWPSPVVCVLGAEGGFPLVLPRGGGTGGNGTFTFTTRPSRPKSDCGRC